MSTLTDVEYRELSGIVCDALFPLSATNTLPQYCDRLGLFKTNLVAFNSKRSYINSRIQGVDEDELLVIAKKVKRDYPSEQLIDFLTKLEKSRQSISEITRKDILDALRLSQFFYYGSCSEIDFIKRIFNLDVIPSNDSRYKTFEGDWTQHTINNDDWECDWFFTDSRFNLLHILDDVFIKFLCETIHPIVRPKIEDVQELLQLFNKYLKNDNWELYEYTRVSNKPIFRGRKIDFIENKIIPALLDEKEIKKQINRMNDNIEKDPDLAVGTAKELIESCLKIITNTEDRKADIPTLQRKALKELKLVPDDIPEKAKGADKIRVLLSNFSTIVQNIDELRNLYGTGHGKHPKANGLEARHARLAVGAAITFVNFLFETYQKKEQEEKSRVL